MPFGQFVNKRGPPGSPGGLSICTLYGRIRYFAELLAIRADKDSNLDQEGSGPGNGIGEVQTLGSVELGDLENGV